MGLFSKKKPETPVAPEVQETAVSEAETDEELIAVISAAIAAYESGSGASTDLIIRKINRAAGIIPAWGVAGNREQIDTRRM